jgi:hypothetical protein
MKKEILIIAIVVFMLLSVVFYANGIEEDSVKCINSKIEYIGQDLTYDKITYAHIDSSDVFIVNLNHTPHMIFYDPEQIGSYKCLFIGTVSNLSQFNEASKNVNFSILSIKSKNNKVIKIYD